MICWLKGVFFVLMRRLLHLLGNPQSKYKVLSLQPLLFIIWDSSIVRRKFGNEFQLPSNLLKKRLSN